MGKHGCRVEPQLRSQIPDPGLVSPPVHCTAVPQGPGSAACLRPASQRDKPSVTWVQQPAQERAAGKGGVGGFWGVSLVHSRCTRLVTSLPLPPVPRPQQLLTPTGAWSPSIHSWFRCCLCPSCTCPPPSQDRCCAVTRPPAPAQTAAPALCSGTWGAAPRPLASTTPHI